jgi:Nucleotide-diphospho-sugar transferase
MALSSALHQVSHYITESEQTVLTTVTNYGYRLYTLNLLKSLQPFGLDQSILILCLDNKVADVFEKKGYRVIRTEETMEQFCPWNTKGYDKICYMKLEWIYRILSLNKNIVLIDGDIVFKKNLLPYISLWEKEGTQDVWIQNDHPTNQDTRNLCTGFMFIRSNERMRCLYDCISPEGKKKYELCAFQNNDQSYFNEFVKPYCFVCVLPLEEYPNGQVFYIYTEQVESTAVMVHFNWVKGHLKMAKMKEHKMWLLTEEDEDI